MQNDEIKKILMQALLAEEIYINKEGSHYKITVISEQFYNMNRINRHKIIYSPLMQYISNNLIHSLSINAYSPKEWQQLQK